MSLTDITKIYSTCASERTVADDSIKWTDTSVLDMYLHIPAAPAAAGTLIERQKSDTGK